MTSILLPIVTDHSWADFDGPEGGLGMRYLERETGDQASRDRQEARDLVDEVGHGSFPASDPPSWTGGIV